MKEREEGIVRDRNREKEIELEKARDVLGK